MQTAEVKAGRQPNAIGALRLGLAAMVIFAHVPELLDGDRHREPLTRLFHTSLTLGSMAVDGFFLISGYLIAASFMSDPGGYLKKRILRIYPAFVVCSLLSVWLIGPAVGGAWPTWITALRSVYRIATLQTPLSDGSASSLHIVTLNASMWTIAYEFRCYLLAAGFGLIGLYRRPRLFFALSLAVMAATLLPWPDIASERLAAIIGRPASTVRMCGVFMVGTSFRLLQPALNGWIAALACLAVIPCLFVEHVGEIAFVLLGGYALFWLGFKVRWKPLLTLNATDDISYGVYLYGWPASVVLIWFWPGLSLAYVLALTLAATAACGALSWFLIEKPAMALMRNERLGAALLSGHRL